MCSVFSLKFEIKIAQKKVCCVKINVQKVGAEKLRKLRGNLLDFAAKNIEGLELTIFYR